MELMMWLKRGPAVSKMTKMTSMSDTVLVTFMLKKEREKKKKKSHNTPVAISEGIKDL